MPNENTNVQSGYFTHERIQGDLDYHRAQDIAKKMLDDGLISVLNSTNYPPSIGKLSLPCSRK